MPYLHAHHPDIYAFLDTKRENADERRLRIKTLSLGVVIHRYHLRAGEEERACTLLPVRWNVSTVCPSPTSTFPRSTTRWSMMHRITKTKINAREFFQTIAEIQFESATPT